MLTEIIASGNNDIDNEERRSIFYSLISGKTTKSKKIKFRKAPIPSILERSSEYDSNYLSS